MIGEDPTLSDSMAYPGFLRVGTRWLQSALLAAGYPVTPDGRWGPETRGALERFVAANRILPSSQAFHPYTDEPFVALSPSLEAALRNARPSTATESTRATPNITRSEAVRITIREEDPAIWPWVGAIVLLVVGAGGAAYAYSRSQRPRRRRRR